MRARRSLFEKGSEAGLVEVFINSAYDTVKLVADNMEALLGVADIVLDPDFELITEEWVNEQIAQAVEGAIRFEGGYDAALNVPDLTAPANTLVQGSMYTVTTAGAAFYGEYLEAGDMITSNQDSPTELAHWTIVNRNIDSTAFATAAQGALADTALQPGANISELVNDAGYVTQDTNTQLTDQEVEDAYHRQVGIVSQADAEAGVGIVAERWTPQRIAQAIAALETPPQAADVTGYIDQVAVAADRTLAAGDEGKILIVDTTGGDVTITLPSNATAAIPVNSRIDIHHRGANALNIAVGSGALGEGVGTPPYSSRGQWNAISLFKRATDTWVVWGQNDS